MVENAAPSTFIIPKQIHLKEQTHANKHGSLNGSGGHLANLIKRPNLP